MKIKLAQKKKKKKNVKPLSLTKGVPKSKSQSTCIWGQSVEKGDFIKVPRTYLRIGRMTGAEALNIKPKHMILILALAARKFQDKPLAVHWETLAQDIGVTRDTVRRWAYELEEMNLLRIRRKKGPVRGSHPGYRNDANIFDLGPIVGLVESEFNRLSRRGRKKNDGDADPSGEN